MRIWNVYLERKSISKAAAYPHPLSGGQEILKVDPKATSPPPKRL
jgi:hypothetical protein